MFFRFKGMSKRLRRKLAKKSKLVKNWQRTSEERLIFDTACRLHQTETTMPRHIYYWLYIGCIKKRMHSSKMPTKLKIVRKICDNFTFLYSIGVLWGLNLVSLSDQIILKGIKFWVQQDFFETTLQITKMDTNLEGVLWTIEICTH